MRIKRPVRLNEERGAAAIEFGRFYSEYQVLQGAAREGARMAAVRASSDEVSGRVYDAADPYQPTSAPSQSVECSEDTIGDPVTVSWTQHFDIQIPFMPAISKDLQIKGVFRCE